MVFEGIVDLILAEVLLIGLPLFMGLFYLEGLVIGKLLQPPVMFVALVATTTPPWPILVILTIGCTVAVVAGQWTIFRSFDTETSTRVDLYRVPGIRWLSAVAVGRIGDKRPRLVDRLFDRYGGEAIFIATFLPGIRGLLAIPAGLSSYPARRFLAATIAGNALYFPLLIGIAFELLELLGIR